MIRHYLKIALRNLLRYKMQTLISIIGLAVGFASFALSGLWVEYEQSYDDFHDGADRIYVASRPSVLSSGGYATTTSPLLASYLTTTFPEIEAATYAGFTREFNDGQNRHWKMISIDSTFTSLLPVTVLEGSLQFLYNTANEVAITDKAARMLFGKESAIGKEYPFDKRLTVTAVVKEWEGHSNYDFDVIARNEAPEYQEWGYAAGMTLFRVAKGTDMDALRKKLEGIEVALKNRQMKYPVKITPLTEWHYTYPRFNTFVRIEYVRLFCLISLLIVLGALFNYLILYLIRIRMRQREWALRKVNGATERSLIALLMYEIILLLTAAVLTGFLLVELSLPVFKHWSHIHDEENSFFYKETFLYMSAAIGVVLLFVWCTLVVQRHFTLQSAISSVHARRFSAFYRRAGLWFQLVISIGFIFCTVVMMKQLNHLSTSADMGITHPEVEYVAFLQGVPENETEGWVKLIRFLSMVAQREQHHRRCHRLRTRADEIACSSICGLRHHCRLRDILLNQPLVRATAQGDSHTQSERSFPHRYHQYLPEGIYGPAGTGSCRCFRGGLYGHEALAGRLCHPYRNLLVDLCSDILDGSFHHFRQHRLADMAGCKAESGGSY